jgi:hypothetical protein
MRGVSWLAEQLLAPQGLSSMELIIIMRYDVNYHNLQLKVKINLSLRFFFTEYHAMNVYWRVEV